MATLYEYLADSTRAKYPLESLDPKAAKFLSTEVPETYSQAKLQRILGLVERGVGKYARSGTAVPPAADRTGAAPVSPSQALARRPGVDYAAAAKMLQGRLSPFNDGESPEQEPGTYSIYRGANPVVRAAMRLAEQVYPFGAGALRMAEEFGEWQSGMSIPDKTPSHVDIVPGATNAAEHATDVGGSVLGFTAATAAGTMAGLPGMAALGLAGALPEEGARNRAIAAGTTMAAGQAGHALGARLAPKGANLARQAGAGAVGAVAFGAGEPAARTLTQRLTGDPDYPAPTLEDLVRGTAELGAVNALGLLGAQILTRGRSGARVLGPERQLPPARAPKSRQLPPAPAAPGEAREMPGDPNAPAPVLPASRRLPPGPTPPGPEPILAPAGKTTAQVRNPVLEKLAPEFAQDRRLVAAGRTVADVFAEMVEAEAGKAPDRAAWKAAVRKVVASGRIRAVQEIAEALAEPGDAARRGVTPELRARETRFTEELNRRAAGRTMTLNIDGEQVNVRIARVAAFRYPGVDRPVRVIVEDATNGKLFPLRFRNVAELSQAANNPQALVKAEDVFARAERQRAVVKPQARATAGEGTSEGAPAAAAAAAAPAAPTETAPPARKRAAYRPPTPPRPGPATVEPRVPAAKRAEYVRRLGEGLAAAHDKLRGQQRIKFKARLWEQARDKSADPADRLGAVEALRRIQAKEMPKKGEGGPGESPGTGPSEPPPVPSKPAPTAPAAGGGAAAAPPARKRVAIGMEFSDPKKAQAVADRMNRDNPDVEAAVVMKRGKPVVEVNEDAAVAPPKPKVAEKPATLSPEAERLARRAAEMERDWVMHDDTDRLAFKSEVDRLGLSPAERKLFMERRDELLAELKRKAAETNPAPKAEPAAEPAAEKPKAEEVAEDTRPYFRGDPIRFTGKRVEKHGTSWREFEYLDGHRKGEKGVAHPNEYPVDKYPASVAAEGAAEAGRPAGGASEPPAAPAAQELVATVGEHRIFSTKSGRFVVRDAEGKAITFEEKLADAVAESKKAQGLDEFGRKPSPPAAVDPAADLEAMRQQSRFKIDQKISVPNEGAAHNDTRVRRKGFVVGWERDKDGSVRVRVRVQKGKSGWREFSVREENARALPSKAAREAGVKKRAEAGAKLTDTIYEQVKGNPRAAREMVRKYADIKEDALNKAEALKTRSGRVPTEHGTAYRKLREAAVEADRAMTSAEEARERVLEEVFGPKRYARGYAGAGSVDEILHRDIAPFFERERDVEAWTAPMREAAEDLPQHFTLERQARYLHRAATMELPNAAEWKSEIDFERGLADRGVAPEHAAYATEATGRLRRYVEQLSAELKDNPLLDESDIAPYRDMLKPERVDTPEALAKTLKEFDDAVPRGPADDIPAGVKPEPPEGFVERLNERGIVNAEILAPWMWLKVLREIPRAFARAKRNIPRRNRKFTIYDASGNALETRDHMLYEPDYYSESALTRLLAHIGVEPGAHVLTPELRSSYKASISDHARIKAEWRFHLVSKLGIDLANKVRAYSKTSKQLDRVLEGLAPESSLPADIRPAVKAFKDWYAERWEIIKKQARDLGEPEPTSKLEGRYVGPRLIQGHISQTIERMFADLIGEGRVTPEVTDMKNRFLHERTGDPVYREDAMYRAAEYIDAMSRYLAHRQFFKDVKEFAEANRMTDRRRVGAVINLMKATLLRKKGWLEKYMDTALANIRYASAPPEIIEHTLETAAKHLNVEVAQLQKGSGIERVFVVPKGARYRVGNDAKAFVLGELENGSTLVGTGGAHLFGEMPKLWSLEERAKRKSLRVKVEKLAAAEAANKKMTGEEGAYLSPHFSKDEHVQMMFDEWRDMVLQSRNDLTAAAFRGMGDRLTRAVLGNNLRAVLQNSMQPMLTLAPEIGYRRTLQAMIENAMAGKRGKLTAEVTGSLQGELVRTEELMQQASWFRRVNEAFGPMAGYKFAEDFTRGVGMMAGEIVARRMGIKSPVPMDFNGEINAKFFDDWRLKTEAIRKGGTTENLQQTLDTETMYDYNMLGQSPIFGGALGKLFGRLMTFPGRYFRRAVTRPLGGATKVARALVLGGVDRATGGALKAAGMPTGPSGKWRRGYKARGKYTGPTNAFDEFLEYYGARAHDRQGAHVFLRQIQGMGMLAGVAAATGLNAFIVGTPGWERVPLLALLSMVPPNTALHARIKKMLDTTQRSAVVDPERGVESTMSPLIRTGYTFTKEQPRAFGAAYRKAQEGDPAGAAAALSAPLQKALGETGRQMLIPSLVAIRRLFQQMPLAEQFFNTDAGKTFAHVMGIKTYIKGNGAWGFVKGTLGLADVTDEARRRVRVDKPKAEGQRPRRPRKARAARGSIYSSVLGMGGQQEAFA